MLARQHIAGCESQRRTDDQEKSAGVGGMPRAADDQHHADKGNGEAGDLRGTQPLFQEQYAENDAEDHVGLVDDHARRHVRLQQPEIEQRMVHDPLRQADEDRWPPFRPDPPQKRCEDAQHDPKAHGHHEERRELPQTDLQHHGLEPEKDRDEDRLENVDAKHGS